MSPPYILNIDEYYRIIVFFTVFTKIFKIDMMLCNSISGAYRFETGLENLNDVASSSITEFYELHSNDFIVVSFETNERARRFIGQVTKVKEAGVVVKCLRKKEGMKEGFFVFPQVEDVCEVKHAQVERRISPILVRKGQHRFLLDVTHLEFCHVNVFFFRYVLFNVYCCKITSFLTFFSDFFCLFHFFSFIVILFTLSSV